MPSLWWKMVHFLIIPVGIIISVAYAIIELTYPITIAKDNYTWYFLAVAILWVTMGIYVIYSFCRRLKHSPIVLRIFFCLVSIAHLLCFGLNAPFLLIISLLVIVSSFTSDNYLQRFVQ